MVDPEKNEVETQKDEIPQFTSEYCHALVCICLKLLGGVSVTKKTFDNFPKNVKWTASYDEANKRYNIFVPQERKRGIIKPKKKIIVPR